MRGLGLGAGALLALVASHAAAQTLIVDGSNSPFEIASPASYASLVVADGGVLHANAPITVSGDVTVQRGGRISLARAPDAGVALGLNDFAAFTLELTAGGRITVEAGAVIDAAGRGIPPGMTIDPNSGAIASMSCFLVRREPLWPRKHSLGGVSSTELR